MNKHEEQELGLLAEHCSEEDADLLTKLEPSQRLARLGWLKKHLKVILSGTFALLIAIALTLALGQRDSSTAALLHDTITSSDYIVSREWDYEAGPARREYTWTITDTTFNPDGVYRPMIVINKRFPGPMIEVNEGDTIVVHIHNQAQNATSIHWHGLYQNGTNWMDGTVGITQCSIAPGTRFDYEFTVPKQYGTYWYHAHQGVQASDGLVGPLIIHSQEERDLQELEYASDRVVMVSDHYHSLTSQLLMSYLASDNENAEPVPDGALINGRAVKDCSKFPLRKCDNTTSNIGIPRFKLAPNRNHRLRFINVGAFAEFQIAIDEHQLAIIEVDGTPVKPSFYDRFAINSAQRYSIITNTNVTSMKTFWLRAKMLSTCFTDAPKDLDSEVWGVIQYGDEAELATQLPSSQERDPSVQSTCRDMNTTELVPSKPISAPAKADSTFYLRANFEIGAWRLSRGVFNQSSWRPNLKSPTIARAMDGLVGKNASFDAIGNRAIGAFVNDVAFNSKQELVVQTSGVQVLDIIITNFDDGNHPLHLHGYKYFVLGQGHGYPPADLASTVDLSNPLRRDTASVEAYGWLHIRFIADNPGAWAFHCHISWHTEAGLLMQFLTRTDLLSSMDIPRKNRDLCSAPLSELRKGAGPEDRTFYGSIGA
ncbi:MAG: hypothetical protein LQ340_002563 [Diploschistes diacapsis]|nr:MAG: hypothetical protein LQ340_002563 [Diploschistes diacapsis]